MKKEDDYNYSVLNKNYLYIKHPNEAQYQYLINKRENIGHENLKGRKTFIEYSNNIHNIYKNIKEYNPNRNCNVLIVYKDMIADTISNENINSIVTELFIRVREVNRSLAFITRSYFAIPKHIRLNFIHYFFENSNKWELQKLAFDHLSDIAIIDFMNLYNKCTAKQYSFHKYLTGEEILPPNQSQLIELAKCRKFFNPNLGMGG